MTAPDDTRSGKLVTPPKEWLVRPPLPSEIPGLIEVCAEVYPTTPPWRVEQLESHQRVFPEGQLVAVDPETGQLVGMAASLVVLWNDYDMRASWRDFTAAGYFVNHDPRGRTLYGAEIMVRPSLQGQGVGRVLYRARRELVERMGLLRIRAGARLRGYSHYAHEMTPEEYAEKVVGGEIWDPTLSFQLRHGFEVLDVVPGYLRVDPESLGHAAVIEWVNPAVATPTDYGHGDPRFRRGGQK